MSGDNGGYIAAVLGAVATGTGSLAVYLAAKLGVVQKRQRDDQRQAQTAMQAEVDGRQNLLLGWERIAADRQKEIDALREALRVKDEEIARLWQSIWSHQRDSIEAQDVIRRLREEIVDLEGRLGSGR